MEKLIVCRICLAENVRIHLVINRNLHELYEKLTNIPFVTEDCRPILACFFCFAKLKQCYQLLRKCLKAEELFAQMMNEGYEPNSLINQNHLEFSSGFIKSPIEHLCIVDECQRESIAIKEELPAVCAALEDIIDPKEGQSGELELENLDSSCLDVADIPPRHSESNLEDGVLIMEFKTEGEEHEVSKKKRRTRETERATVAKKPKLDTRRKKLEDALTAEQTKNSKSKFIRTTEKQLMVKCNVGLDEVPEEGSLELSESGEQEEVHDAYEELEYLDIEYFEPGLEYFESPTTLLQEGEEVPLGLPQGPPMARPSPTVIAPRPSPSASCAPMAVDKSGPRVMQPVRVCHIDGGDFHLADHTFQQAVEQPSMSTSGRSLRGARRRGPRGPAGVPRGGRVPWCVQVHVEHDDVPEDSLLVRARAAERVRATARARRPKPVSEAHDENDAFLGADDGQDEALFTGMEVSSRFEWSSMSDHAGHREKFLPQQTGPTVASKNAYAAFRQYWDDGILSHIVTETNRHAQGLISSSAAFAQHWYDTNVHEILILFSFWMMLGIIKMPSTKSCFTVIPHLKTNIFSKMFSLRRYELLCCALYFNDDRNRPTDMNTDPLFSLGPVMQHLNSRFKEAYVPSQNIYIDESLTLSKGNFSIRQDIKTKAVKFGVKTFELCESSTGYLWSFFMYLGAPTTYDPTYPSTLLKSTLTVLTLVRPLLNKGYTLFMDNWFNSPLLARFLKAHKTDCVGTLRTNRSHVPPLISQCQLKEGQFVARHSGDIVVMAYHDKTGTIGTISTYHGIHQGRMEPKPYREVQFIPQVILDYNKGMGSVDRQDQILDPYLLEKKKCSNWNMYFFKRLLNASILNSLVLYETSTRTSNDLLYKDLVFRLELVDQILQNHHDHTPKPTRPSTAPASASTRAQPESTSVHFPRQNDF